jgi:magnesium transporter
LSWIHFIRSNSEWIRFHTDQPADGSEELRTNIPFEAHAIEAIFATVCTLLNQDTKAIDNKAHSTLQYFKSKTAVILPYAVQERMRELKNAASATLSRATSLGSMLTSLVNDTEALALMNLTKLGEQPSLYKAPLRAEILVLHEENEEMVEAYMAEVNGLRTKLGYLLEAMQNAEDSMMLKLDTSRNQVLVAEMFLTVVAALVTFAAFIAGIFGMNLDNTVTLQNVLGLFEIVFILTLMIIFGGLFAVVYYLQRSGVIPRVVSAQELDS